MKDSHTGGLPAEGGFADNDHLKNTRLSVQKELERSNNFFVSNALHDWTPEETRVLVETLNKNKAFGLTIRAKVIPYLEGLRTFSLKIDDDWGGDVLTDKELEGLSKTHVSILDLSHTEGQFTEGAFRTFLTKMSSSLTYLKLPKFSRSWEMSWSPDQVIAEMIEEGALPHLLQVEGLFYVADNPELLDTAEKTMALRQKNVWDVLNALRKGGRFPSEVLGIITPELQTMGILQPYGNMDFSEQKVRIKERTILGARNVRRLLAWNRGGDFEYPAESPYLMGYGTSRKNFEKPLSDVHQLFIETPTFPIWLDGDNQGLPKLEMLCLREDTSFEKMKDILQETKPSMVDFGCMRKSLTTPEFSVLLSVLDEGKTSYVGFSSYFFADGEEKMPGYIDWTMAGKKISDKLEKGDLPYLVVVDGILFSEMTPGALDILQERNVRALEDLTSLKQGIIPEGFDEKRRKAVWAVSLTQKGEFLGKHAWDNLEPSEMITILTKMEKICPKAPKAMKGAQSTENTMGK